MSKTLKDSKGEKSKRLPKNSKDSSKRRLLDDLRWEEKGE